MIDEQLKNDFVNAIKSATIENGCSELIKLEVSEYIEDKNDISATNTHCLDNLQEALKELNYVCKITGFGCGVAEDLTVIICSFYLHFNETERDKQ